MEEHTSIGSITTTEAGMEIHLKSGMQTIIDGGLSLTLKAGGQHIVLNPAGIWMTTPQWIGGAPMEGTPAIPLIPERIANYYLQFHFADQQARPYAFNKYTAYFPDGTTQSGTTDKNGYTETFYSNKDQEITVHLEEQESIEPVPSDNTALCFHFVDDNDTPHAHKDYIAFYEDGTTSLGITDEDGYTEIFRGKAEKQVAVHLLLNEADEQEVI